MTGVVRSLECAAPHPDLGWTCLRQRGHAGEHLAAEPFSDTGSLAPVRRTTWRDFRECCSSYPETEHMVGCSAEGDTLDLPDPMGPLRMDEVAETVTFLEPAVVELEPTPILEAFDTPWRRYGPAVLVTLELLLLAAAPGLLVIVYRLAF